jgi:hypothetical protein
MDANLGLFVWVWILVAPFIGIFILSATAGK